MLHTFAAHHVLYPIAHQPTLCGDIALLYLRTVLCQINFWNSMENLNMVQSTEITTTYNISNFTYKSAKIFETENYSNVIYKYIYLFINFYMGIAVVH